MFCDLRSERAFSCSEPRLSKLMLARAGCVCLEEMNHEKQENLFIINYMENTHLSLTLIAALNYCRPNSTGRSLELFVFML